MRIRIDSERCTGHGRCYSLAPDLYEADEEGRGVAINHDVPPDLEDGAQRSAAGCPDRAIFIEE